ncbi:sulfite exporter TauE/SafE (macronuclear) [Tetrahymena thermophila SB210]|uniref:Sulfite exporter TauE/SafE n=1 Tax=Tetrahymena thermophila (strain SB210) TaxID=312017 RepID=I7MHH6_TETTS|nr:sulfite exporter TauE/SafE [Tetrahymena thermophila SB210]EAR87544.2 sulfite exporter TauE/SafE [Tetrahymena thermophila SB210]|eukprot:XP_001007789.2 sulfite exporter TauE/SafE [Tetrahymena thermophila SB210]
MSTVSCHTNNDCDFNFHCSNKVCVYNDLWPPSAFQVIVYILIPFIIGVSNVGGLGGGIIKVPLITVMLNYPSKVATFISYCILFGSSVVHSTIIIFKKHPLFNKPIIDYNIVLVINPMVLLGTNAGILLNVLMPEIVAGVIICVYLSLIAPYILFKAISLYKITKKQQQQIEPEAKALETVERKNEGEVQVFEMNVNDIQKMNGDPINTVQDQRILITSNPILKEQVSDKTGTNTILPIQITPLSPSIQKMESAAQLEDQLLMQRVNSYYVPQEPPKDKTKRGSIIVSQNSLKETPEEPKQEQIMTEELKAFYDEEYQQFPKKKILLLVIIFCIIQYIVFQRGGKGLQSFVGIKTCSASYWVSNGAILVLCVAAIFVIRYYLLKWTKNKNEIIKKYNLQKEFEGDFNVLNKTHYFVVLLAGLAAGLVAGTVGVGAGLTLVPLLLSIGVHPQVVAATCGFNYLFIATTTIIQVFTSHYLSYAQIVLFSLLSFVGGFIIAKCIYNYVEKRKNGYALVFIVFGLCILSIVTMMIYLIRKDILYGYKSLIQQTPFCQAQ